MRILSLPRFTSSPSFWSRNIASAAWYVTSNRLRMSNSYLDNLSRRCASFPDALRSLSFHLRVGCLVQTVNRFPSRCGRKSRNAHATVRLLQLAVLYQRSAYMSDLDQYPISLGVHFSVHEVRGHWFVCCRPRNRRRIGLWRELVIE